jgi:hypothetical protein
MVASSDIFIGALAMPTDPEKALNSIRRTFAGELYVILLSVLVHELTNIHRLPLPSGQEIVAAGHEDAPIKPAGLTNLVHLSPA